MQYCRDKTIAWSGDIYEDNSGILRLVNKCFGITHTSVQNVAVRKLLRRLRKLKVL